MKYELYIQKIPMMNLLDVLFQDITIIHLLHTIRFLQSNMINNLQMNMEHIDIQQKEVIDMKISITIKSIMIPIIIQALGNLFIDKLKIAINLKNLELLRELEFLILLQINVLNIDVDSENIL